MNESNIVSSDSSAAIRYSALSATCHPDCVACRDPESGGLGLRFDLRDDGSVVTRFFCEKKYQGYPDRMHGGIIATLLDAAMTHCLFAHNKRGVTAKLAIRYNRPVIIGADAIISAEVTADRGMLVELNSEIQQSGQLCASSQATFFVQTH